MSTPRIEQSKQQKTIFDYVNEMVYPRFPLAYSPEEEFKKEIAAQPDLIYSRNQGFTPLLYAVYIGSSAAVSTLFECDVDIDVDETDSKGNTALELAIRSGKSGINEKEMCLIVKLLLKHGAYVTEVMIEVTRKNKLNKIAKIIEAHIANLTTSEKRMRMAIRENNEEVMEELFNEGFPIDRMPSKASLAMIARREAPAELAIFLSELADIFSITPLSSDEQIQQFKKLLARYPIAGYWTRCDGYTLFDLQSELFSLIALERQQISIQPKYDDEAKQRMLANMKIEEIKSSEPPAAQPKSSKSPIISDEVLMTPETHREALDSLSSPSKAGFHAKTKANFRVYSPADEMPLCKKQRTR